jgi:hypothetical protein
MRAGNLGKARARPMDQGQAIACASGSSPNIWTATA